MTTNIYQRLMLCIMLAAASILSLGVERASAQITECNCATITIVVEKEVACRVSLEFARPDGTTETKTFSQGTSTSVPCDDGMSVSLLDCLGRPLLIPEGGCLINKNASPSFACCVDACLTQDPRGCWVVLIRPTISTAPTCPCL